eukprot:jgi/Chrzof1/7449/Cz02g24130.t1
MLPNVTTPASPSPPLPDPGQPAGEAEVLPAVSCATWNNVEAALTASGDYNTSVLLRLSLLFYDAQRAGKLPDSRICWRADSGLDAHFNGADLSGGYYDAGDTVKFNFPQAWSLSVLAWGLLEWPQSYTTAGSYQHALQVLKWGTDYLLSCHIGPTTLVAQVGNGVQDHARWEPPENPYDKLIYLIDANNPGSDLAAATSAALAAASLVFSNVNSTYAQVLLGAAQELYQFAKSTAGTKYSDVISDAAVFYASSSCYDDLAWAAVWLHIATGTFEYLNDAEMNVAKWDTREGGMYTWTNWDWDNQWGVHVLLSRLRPTNAIYSSRMDRFVNSWLRGQDGVLYTPKGLAWQGKWGTLRHTAAAAFLLLAYAHGKPSMDFDRVQSITCFAHQQTRYMLGDAGRSFVVGYGINPPTHVHHRGASCPRYPQPCGKQYFNSGDPNQFVLYGALVGGPDAADVYNDIRADYTANEVAVDYNAAFTGLMAAMMQAGISYAECPGAKPTPAKT